jgi:hypothetical protein
MCLAQLNHQVLYNIDSFDRMINDLNVEFNSHLTPSTAILYRASRSYLDEAMKIRNLSAAALGNNLASRSSNIGADSNLSASYICSHLVADILFKLGALYPSAIIETKYFVPADLSSSSIVPGISLWFRSGETKSQLYSISPDIEFQKAGRQFAVGLICQSSADFTVAIIYYNNKYFLFYRFGIDCR